MSKTTIGNCVHCGKPFDDSTTIWMLKSQVYHPSCIRRNQKLLDEWRATAWQQKEIM